ncbi:MAG: ATP-binding protein [Gammaproteobacteria bacterium]|nr:ATP-binding protein [Gammaproteobacteria bacterium]
MFFFTTKRDYLGKGLGLSIAHRLAIEHGGNLTVADRPGGGAIFRLSLPVER